MNEEALRALVRDTIERLSTPGAGEPPSPPFGARQPLPLARHASHYRYTLTKTDGPCLIEPSVHCNHCGYCESHGH
jgi:hypothetical protein